MIVWTERFKTGAPELDQQHRLLIDNINLLEELLHITNPTAKEIDFAFGLVDYLDAYSDLHFKCEEQCMENHRCPARTNNLRGHGRFRGFIREYRKLTDQEGFNVVLLRELHEKMHNWIQEHILGIDVQLKPCVARVS